MACTTILPKLLGTQTWRRLSPPTIWAQGSNSGCQFVAGPLILINSKWQISRPKNVTLFCRLDKRTSATPFSPLRKWTQGFQTQELSQSLVGPGLELQVTLDLRALELSQHPEVERINPLTPQSGTSKRFIFFHFKSTKGDVHEEQFKKQKNLKILYNYKNLAIVLSIH